MKIVFIGGLTNGKLVLDYLLSNKHVTIELIITHPSGMDLPRYVDLNHYHDNIEIIGNMNANKYIDKIRDINPDFIFVTGWSGLLSNELLSIPVKSVIGFHPAKLPNDRGRSVLAWQIEEGYTESALSMFHLNSTPDLGDIIAQEKFKIEENDYINDVLDKLDVATYNLMRSYFPLIRKDNAPRLKQNINEGNFRRLRNDYDSLINWDSNGSGIFNKIRAISKPYPGAVAKLDGKNIKIWRAKIVNKIPIEENLSPGTLVAKFYDSTLLVKCRDSFIHILDYEEI